MPRHNAESTQYEIRDHAASHGLYAKYKNSKSPEELLICNSYRHAYLIKLILEADAQYRIYTDDYGMDEISVGHIVQYIGERYAPKVIDFSNDDNVLEVEINRSRRLSKLTNEEIQEITHSKTIYKKVIIKRMIGPITLWTISI